ncbi:response regulator [bacterium]|nr:response regulator [bacterium]
MSVRKIRIALIEDPRTVWFYKHLFENAGYHVLEAENAKEGWKIICNQKPDIIVLDTQMPEIPGIELLKKIRKSEFSKHTPVLVLTSVKDSEEIKEIFKQGADYYALKGMDSPNMIKETINQLLKTEQEKRVIRSLDGKHSDDEEASATEIDREFFWFE